ncbi:DUF6445 family protein [uncultured Sphingomonas sp.]|uniref:DUF6445 family protein n=1 Tax=uncultured Sphingomonas sp. TaxID=158754 RepID=UPI0025D35724|nr:DUF6445 family protein [uncultured Sphingomonas sp.]
MKPFEPLKVFAVNKDLKATALDLGNGDKAIIIDGFYENPEAVRDLCLESPAPIWKHRDGSQNGISYWDCRQQWHFFDTPPFLKVISDLVVDHFGVDVDRARTTRAFTTNLFRWNVDQPPGSIGNVAHYDGVKVMAANIYLNLPSEAHGGTAIYRSRHSGQPRIFAREYLLRKAAPEQFPYLNEDGLCYYALDWQEHWELAYLLEMKFNRLVLYPGYMYHGAYHVDNAFRQYPRITQTCFIDCTEVPNQQRFLLGGDALHES